MTTMWTELLVEMQIEQVKSTAGIALEVLPQLQILVQNNVEMGILLQVKTEKMAIHPQVMDDLIELKK